MLGLNENRKLILFGATGGTSDPRKGFRYLIKVLEAKKLKNEKFELMLLGEPENLNLNITNRKIIFKPGSFYGNDTALRVLYSAADLIVAPSLMEAFGQVGSEAGSSENSNCGI